MELNRIMTTLDKDYSLNTLKTYKSSLKKLNEAITGLEFKNLDFLKDFTKVMKVINVLNSLETKKTRLTTVLAFLKSNEYDEQLINKYKKEFDKIKKQIISNQEENQKSNKELDNWIHWDDIIKLRTKLKIKVDNLMSKIQ